MAATRRTPLAAGLAAITAHHSEQPINLQIALQQAVGARLLIGLVLAHVVQRVVIARNGEIVWLLGPVCSR